MTAIIIFHLAVIIIGFIFLDILFGIKERNFGYSIFNDEKTFRIVFNNESIIVPFSFYDEQIEIGDFFEVITTKGRYTNINYSASIIKL